MRPESGTLRAAEPRLPDARDARWLASMTGTATAAATPTGSPARTAALRRFHGLGLGFRDGSALPCPAPTDGLSNEAAGFASCYGPHRRSPYRASDAGLRPGPFPGRAASLLPGLLAATRTGLPPAGDGELTNTKTTMA